MSALGKHLDGDFDTNGQVVQTPAAREPERTVVITRTVTSQTVPLAEPRAEPAKRNPGWTCLPGPSRRCPIRWRPGPSRGDLVLDRARDALLTPFGKATLTDRYLMPGESFQDMFARVSCAYADDVRPCPAPVRRHEPAVVHAGHADPVQWRHQARPADFLLPE